MRFACRDGRLSLWTQEGLVDVAGQTGGELPADPMAAFDRWSEVAQWADEFDPQAARDRHSTDPSTLGPPSPQPRQVFAIGLNYRAHAAEAGFPLPEFPVVFTKFSSCLSGPRSTVRLPSPHVDWEAELVVVIGRRAHDIMAGTGWDHVAGLTGGQDLSERRVQHRPPTPQWSLGKSFPGFGPTGPFLVTADEFEDPDAIAIRTTLNGVVKQQASTSDLIFPVGVLVEQLARVTVLMPGDLIFTGTPPGVGHARHPEEFLAPGDVLVTELSNIGSLVQHFV